MSDHSLKRSYLSSILLLTCLIFATSAFADSPSGRYESRMVWDAPIHRAVLFGGSTPLDSGTQLAYELQDTWEWTGMRWVQRFLAHSPPPRAGHSMIYDSARGRVVMFGGREAKLNLNDTWTYDGNDWTQIQTTNAPSIRELAGAAYDSKRDRFVLFGGTLQTYTNNGHTLTLTPLHDTWEFDGTNWTQILADGPVINSPTLEYDPVRNQTIMIGYEPTKITTLMYAYDPVAAKWNQLTPATLPACANEGAMTWQSSDNTILFTGAVCAGSALTEDSYEWDGTNWTKLPLLLFAGRFFGEAMTFDPDHQVAVLFGGAPASGPLLAATYTYALDIWESVGDTDYPVPRSLHSFVTDPVHNLIYLYGGVNDATTFFDFWIYQNGKFYPTLDGSQPSDCSYSLAAFDPDRQKMVMVCNGSATWEFDSLTWTEFDTSKTAPPVHKFSSLVYDQNLKKIILFGGFDGVGTYYDQTWTYDGTAWTQVKKNPPPSRALAAMWYDATLKKTVIYGGIGRITTTDRLTRYSDMWSFDGTGWTQITPTTNPGMRYGAETVVDPNTNHLLLFGGIRLDVDATNNQVQSYVNDMWEWDGTNWKQVNTAVVPPARENGGFAYDTLRGEFVMFGGYSGFYLSDLWSFKNGQWRQLIEVLDRRRASH